MADPRDMNYSCFFTNIIPRHYLIGLIAGF
jgi:hypothetical protein